MQAQFLEAAALFERATKVEQDAADREREAKKSESAYLEAQARYKARQAEFKKHARQQLLEYSEKVKKDAEGRELTESSSR